MKRVPVLFIIGYACIIVLAVLLTLAVFIICLLDPGMVGTASGYPVEPYPIEPYPVDPEIPPLSCEPVTPWWSPYTEGYCEACPENELCITQTSPSEIVAEPDNHIAWEPPAPVWQPPAWWSLLVDGVLDGMK